MVVRSRRREQQQHRRGTPSCCSKRLLHVEHQSGVRRVAAGATVFVIALVGATVAASIACGLHEGSFVGGHDVAVTQRGNTRSDYGREVLARLGRPKFYGYKGKERMRYGGFNRKFYLERLEHRRWAAQSKYPRIFGFVDSWDDTTGEGIISSQENHSEQFLAIRDEIGRCWHNFKTLRRVEFVEFFKSDEIDEVTKLPLALNISGPFGRPVKGSVEYGSRIMKYCGIGMVSPWKDNEPDYPNKVGEWYTKWDPHKNLKAYIAKRIKDKKEARESE